HAGQNRAEGIGGKFRCRRSRHLCTREHGTTAASLIIVERQAGFLRPRSARSIPFVVRNVQLQIVHPMPSWLTVGKLQDILSWVNRFGETQFPHRRRRGFGERSDLDDLRAVSRFPPARPPSLQLEGA